MRDFDSTVHTPGYNTRDICSELRPTHINADMQSTRYSFSQSYYSEAEMQCVCVQTFTGASVRFEMISTMASTFVATDRVVTDRAASAIVSTTLVHV